MTTAERIKPEITSWSVSDGGEIENFQGEIVATLGEILRLSFRDGSVLVVPLQSDDEKAAA